MDDTKTNCYEETGYYVREDGKLITKQFVRVDPPLHRERITSMPIAIGIADRYGMVIDHHSTRWDEIGRDKPDGIIAIKNDADFWIEHTRIGDHFQHFINETLKAKSDQLLNALGAPMNLFIYYPDGTQTKAASNLCRAWESWDYADNVRDAYKKIVSSNSVAEKKTVQGYRLRDREITFRIYSLETKSMPLDEIIEKEIRTKEKKYGMMAGNTVLVIDDETRSYTAGEVMEAAQRMSKIIKSTFKAVYVVSFTGLENNDTPHWLMTPIKEWGAKENR